MKECIWLFLSFSIFICTSINAQLPDEEFSQLRTQVSKAAGQSPLAGIEQVEKIINEYNQKLANFQTIRLLYLKSWYQINADRLEAALDTLAQARLMARDIKEPGILYSYYSISASAFSNIELYDLALKNNLKAYQEAPLLNRPQFIAQTENNIGHVYLKLGLLEEAENYFQRFYNSAMELDLASQQATGLNNLGEVAYLQGKLGKAKQLHQEALEIRRANGYDYHLSWSLYNLGRVYASEGNFRQAEQYLKDAIKNWQNKSAHSKTDRALLELVKIYLIQNRFDEAQAKIEQVIQLAEQYKHFSSLQRALKLKSELMQQSGELIEALEALKQYNSAYETFTKKQASIGLAYMLSQTELQTKEMALKQLEQAHQITLAKAESERRQGWIILCSSLIIITVTWAFMYRLNSKKRQLQNLLTQLNNTQEKLVESEKMRAMTTLVSGMAHQLNTPLGLVITADSSLQSLVERLSTQFSSQSLTQKLLEQFIHEATELLQLSQKNSEKAADMVQRFKMMSAKLQISELTNFCVLSFLQSHTKTLIATQQKSIQLCLDGENIELTNYAPVLLKVIAQLIENSVKHGFTNTENPKIEIVVECDANEHVLIHYKDNGSGIAIEKRKQIFDPFYTTRLGEGSLGLGLNIIYNSVVHIMCGQIDCIEDSEGAHFVIRIPKEIPHNTVFDASPIVSHS
ncbi:tetratricopeptide repeat protein [Pseudoalteromonas sp. JBTF-M23]|uniref:histidine kinase n=1 Tax=Pseudoalteromonas caenipelagi TaxID=2726988 RepID=A0A849VIE9_9GAMM|nr:tetratricopeptide repeat protein [Pseudoalteromonas caenipelagi]NOU52253.1 tetratricopeptide repeat protein [Pseudoalteromonas caenipelagi]